MLFQSSPLCFWQIVFSLILSFTYRENVSDTLQAYFSSSSTKYKGDRTGRLEIYALEHMISSWFTQLHDDWRAFAWHGIWCLSWRFSKNARKIDFFIHLFYQEPSIRRNLKIISKIKWHEFSEMFRYLSPMVIKIKNINE